METQPTLIEEITNMDCYYSRSKIADTQRALETRIFSEAVNKLLKENAPASYLLCDGGFIVDLRFQLTLGDYLEEESNPLSSKINMGDYLLILKIPSSLDKKFIHDPGKDSIAYIHTKENEFKIVIIKLPIKDGLIEKSEPKNTSITSIFKKSSRSISHFKDFPEYLDTLVKAYNISSNHSAPIKVNRKEIEKEFNTFDTNFPLSQQPEHIQKSYAKK